jgi:hypothetical protein
MAGCVALEGTDGIPYGVIGDEREKEVEAEMA